MLLPDAELFRTINNLAGRSALLDAFGIFCASYLFIVMVGLIVGAAWVKRKSFGLALAMRAATVWAVTYLFDQIIGLLEFRPRPFVALRNVHQLIVNPLTDKSFPSDHASSAFALAVTTCFFMPRLGVALLVMAALVAFGRVFVGVHYPLDVFAGALIGAAWALVMRGVLRRIGKKRSRK